MLDRDMAERIRRVEMREWVGWLSHELAQPLSAMSSYVGAALRLNAPESSEQATRALNQSLLQLDRVRTLVQDTRRRFSPYAPSEVDVRKALAEVAAGLGVPASVIRTAGGRPVAIESCRDEIQTIAYHLLRNAIEATGRVTDLGVGIEWIDDVLAVNISNPTEQAVDASCFEPFTSNKPGHLGMGLPIARRLAQTLGASLELAAPAPGEVRFSLLLVP